MAPAKQSAIKRRKNTIRSRKLQLASIQGKASDESTPAVSISCSEADSDSQPEKPISSSASKLSRFTHSADVRSSISSTSMLPTTIVDLNQVRGLFDGLRCTQCRSGHLELSSDSSFTSGFVVKLFLKCDSCDFVKDPSYTSSKNSDRSFSINRLAVAASLSNGMGFSGLSKFCEVLNVPCISEKTFQDHIDFIHDRCSTFRQDILTETVVEVRKAHEVNEEDVADIKVSYDGSWHTRGHKSNNGVGCVVDAKTGLVLDYHVMCRFCKVCSTTGKKLKEGGDGFEDWDEKHKLVCQKNFDQTAGAMEVEAAVVCWNRSLDSKLRYVSVISDGDCKTVKKLNESKPYGEFEIKKEESVNHVAKRLGKALRDLVDTKRKQGITLGGRGEGKLTQAKITKLQKYFTKSIRGSDSVEEMQTSIMATFDHCTSSDNNPKHWSCPDGLNSWCFHQRAIARGDPPPSHKDKLGCFLGPDIADHVLNIYKRLSDKELLSRCLEGKMQNANESLHSLLWSRCPKHIFVNRKRLEIALLLGVAKFNQGSIATQKFLRSLGFAPGSSTIKLGHVRDKRRLYGANYTLLESTKKRKELRDKAKKAEEEELQREEISREGAALYLPGGAN